MRYSDLLMAYNNSLYYSIKKCNKVVEELKVAKAKLTSKIEYLSTGVNVDYGYRLIDQFLQ